MCLAIDWVIIKLIPDPYCLSSLHVQICLSLSECGKACFANLLLSLVSVIANMSRERSLKSSKLSLVLLSFLSPLALIVLRRHVWGALYSGFSSVRVVSLVLSKSIKLLWSWSEIFELSWIDFAVILLVNWCVLVCVCDFGVMLECVWVWLNMSKIGGRGSISWYS